jgi:tetratricopeptide (TPR) repeat protein
MKIRPDASVRKSARSFAQAKQTKLYEVTMLSAQGLAFHQAGRLADAEKIYNTVLAIQPDHFDCLHFLGVIFHQRGKHAEAVRQINLALKRDPKNAFALNNRGNALLALKRFDEALASYDQALTELPDYPDALCNRGAALHELTRYEEALASCDLAIALRPDYAEAHSNRGNTLKELKRHEQALASCDRALALLPGFAEAHLNRGNALHELGKFDEALASHDRAVALRPDYAEALTNRGVTLQGLKRFDEALASYDRAIAVRPDYAEAHYSEAMCRLLIGDFRRGWEKHEWRWQSRQLQNVQRNFSRPAWLGSSEIAGKTILLHAEQGLGDTIQFCRYAPLVAARAGRVILEVQSPLRALLSALPGVAQIVSAGDKLPDADCHCPLLSLPLALGPMPSATPYLRASHAAVMSWNDRLGSAGRPRIGLAWAGSPTHKNDHNRSIALGSFLPALADVEATFVSLQRDMRAGDVAVLQGRPDILHFGDELKDFADTAALISNLDLIISVDTSVAHLAGALGKPVWVLLPVIPDWRWLLDREDSPWYPTARLFRQDDTRGWDNVIARVHAALHGHVRGLQSVQPEAAADV